MGGAPQSHGKEEDEDSGPPIEPTPPMPLVVSLRKDSKIQEKLLPEASEH